MCGLSVFVAPFSYKAKCKRFNSEYSNQLKSFGNQFSKAVELSIAYDEKLSNYLSKAEKLIYLQANQILNPGFSDPLLNDFESFSQDYLNIKKECSKSLSDLQELPNKIPVFKTSKDPSLLEWIDDYKKLFGNLQRGHLSKAKQFEFFLEVYESASQFLNTNPSFTINGKGLSFKEQALNNEWESYLSDLGSYSASTAEAVNVANYQFEDEIKRLDVKHAGSKVTFPLIY